MTWQTSLRSRDLAKIGQIAYPIHRSMGLAIEILWYQCGKISPKIKGEITIWTFSDLWPISRSGQRPAENFIPTNLYRRYASIMVWMNFGRLLLGLHIIRTFICPFCYVIFCHNSMTAWYMISCIMIWAIRPMTYLPTEFHWDILKTERNIIIV